MVGVKVRKKLQFDISMNEPQSNLHHAYKKKHVNCIRPKQCLYYRKVMHLQTGACFCGHMV